MIRNIATACLVIAFFIIVLAGWEWLSYTGSANVVDNRGCVLPEYRDNEVIIKNIMIMQGWSAEMISQSFNCY